MYIWCYVHDCTSGVMYIWCCVYVVSCTCCTYGVVYMSCMWCCVHVMHVVLCTCGVVHVVLCIFGVVYTLYKWYDVVTGLFGHITPNDQISVNRVYQTLIQLLHALDMPPH